ncbi:hypothetical protein ACVGWW_00050, partial [Enterobacter hormaechei]
RRFRAVMMTAVSFIIGVLAMMVAPGARAQSRRLNGTNLFTAIRVAPLVGVVFKPARLVLLHPLRAWAHRHSAVYIKQLTLTTTNPECRYPLYAYN